MSPAPTSPGSPSQRPQRYRALALRPLAASLLIHLVFALPLVLSLSPKPRLGATPSKPSSTFVETSTAPEAWLAEELETSEEPLAFDPPPPIPEPAPLPIESLPWDWAQAPAAEAEFLDEIPEPLDLAFHVKPKPEPNSLREPPAAEAAPEPQPAAEPEHRPTGLAEVNPILLESPAPVYPRRARRNQWEGVVLCRLQVSAEGIVTQAVVERSSGRRSLDQAAITCLLTWRFKPGLRAGQTAAFEILHQVTFQLD